MSGFMQSLSFLHTLSIAAMEEASAFGRQDADIDHLLLALTIDAGVGGQVLRSLGVSHEAVRTAVAIEHASQLGSLGVHTQDAGADGRIVFHEDSRTYAWTERAQSVITNASKGAGQSDSASVLRVLVGEPSGLIAALLARLSITPETVTTRLDEVAAVASLAQRRFTNPLRRVHETFVPASPDAVLALVADPLRIPEWDALVGSVREADEGWEGAAATEAPNGSAITVRPDCARFAIQRQPADAGSVAWRLSFPDSTRANTRLVTFRPEVAAEGTQLHIALEWERQADVHVPFFRRLLRPLMRPAIRFALFMQLTQIAAGISRVFR